MNSNTLFDDGAPLLAKAPSQSEIQVTSCNMDASLETTTNNNDKGGFAMTPTQKAERAKYGSFVNIPDKSDAEKVSKVIKEIDNALLMIQSKKDYIKEAKKALKEEFELTPKSIALMIKLHHKQNAEDHFTEQDEMHDLYHTLFPTKTPVGDDDE